MQNHPETWILVFVPTVSHKHKHLHSLSLCFPILQKKKNLFPLLRKEDSEILTTWGLFENGVSYIKC